MASEGFALSHAPARAAGGWMAAAFTLFLMIVFVGLEPFQPKPIVSAYGGVSRGDALRQLCYILVFGGIVLAAVQRFGLMAARAIPASIALLLVWCMASALWSDYPGVVIRRGGLEVILILSVFLSVEVLGWQRAFAIWKWLLLAILVVNWISIPLIPAAKHFPDEVDTALIGNWRGLYGHKNITGAVCVVTALIFLFTRNGKGNWIGILAAAAATGFLVFSQSKSSLGFLPLSAAAGLAYRIGWKDGLSRAIVTLLGAMALFALGLAMLLEAEALNRLLSDPTEFTGRSAIWAAQIAYIRDHPLLGSGFGTFADTGGRPALYAYITDFWMETISHGHNGFLQLLVTIGGIGFVLAMAALVIAPAIRFWTLDRHPLKPLLFALFVFTLLHNVMESDFLEGDTVTWVTMLMVIALLRNVDETGSRERHPNP